MENPCESFLEILIFLRRGPSLITSFFFFLLSCFLFCSLCFVAAYQRRSLILCKISTSNKDPQHCFSLSLVLISTGLVLLSVSRMNVVSLRVQGRGVFCAWHICMSAMLGNCVCRQYIQCRFASVFVCIPHLILCNPHPPQWPVGLLYAVIGSRLFLRFVYLPATSG